MARCLLLFSLLTLLLGRPCLANALQCHSVFSLHRATMPDRVANPGPRHVGQLPKNLDLQLFPWGTPSRSYVEMARHGELLHQLDTTLDSRGLLVPNGGLCASTCLVNLVGAMTSQTGQARSFRKVAPDLMELTLTTYGLMTQKDGRYGAQVQELADVFQSFSAEFLLGVGFFDPLTRIDFSVEHIDRNIDPNRILSAMRGDTLAIATILPIRPEAIQIYEHFHAITILRIDTKERHIYVSDPNVPNTILRIPYEQTQGTDFIFPMPFTYDGELVRVHNITAFTRHFSEER